MASIIKAAGASCLAIACSITPSYATVYKALTPDGRVVYTDNADAAFSASQDTQKILVMDKLDALTPVTTPTNNPSPANAPASQPMTNTVATDSGSITAQGNPLAVNNVKASQTGDYRLTIESPTVDMAYRKPAQPVDIQVTLNPALRKGDRLVYKINGKHIATTQDTHYQVDTQDYLPQQYTLTVNVENILGEVVASQSRPFYILQNNFVLQKQRKAAAEAKAAYDKLPWYKKIKININL